MLSEVRKSYRATVESAEIIPSFSSFSKLQYICVNIFIRRDLSHVSCILTRRTTEVCELMTCLRLVFGCRRAYVVNSYLFASILLYRKNTEHINKRTLYCWLLFFTYTGLPKKISHYTDNRH